jgi:GH25 family lysozyme M1 (1,4-beta-N-acetylmuramidase)
MELRGIDVSSWQGLIDWKKVKASGVVFAILKAGGSDAGRYKDRYFEKNYAEARANGIKVGAYYFNGRACTSYEAGRADANHFLSLISGKSFDYPCYSDLEAPTSATRNGNTDAVISFCETVKSAGYKAGVYASDISGFKDRLDMSRLSMYDKWVARYGSSPKYATVFQVWQYSSSGIIDGIKGKCDVDISYCDYSSPVIEVYNLWGADFAPVFNPEFYSNFYPDLKQAFGDDHSALWVHFQTFGMNEARQASAEFNVTKYRDRYPDLEKAYGDNLPLYYWHYCYFGKKEGRSGL